MPSAPCLSVYVRVIFKLDTFYKVTKFTTRVLEFWIVLDSSGVILMLSHWDLEIDWPCDGLNSSINKV